MPAGSGTCEVHINGEVVEVSVEGEVEFYGPDAEVDEVIVDTLTRTDTGEEVSFDALSKSDQRVVEDTLVDDAIESYDVPERGYDYGYDREYMDSEFYDGDLIDGVGFADPGGRSALRAATEDNPRNLPCPTCGEPNRLTPIDKARGYQCDSCADRAERGGW